MQSGKITTAGSMDAQVQTVNQDDSKTKSTSKAKDPVPVGQKKSEKKEETKVLAEPKRPKAEGVTDVKVGYGQTLFDIATKYHVTVKDVLNANPNLESANKIREGQTLKVPFVSDKKWNAYLKAKDAYEQEEMRLYEETQKAEAAKELKQKTEMAEAKIQEAKDLKYGKSYDFSINPKTGEIIITLKADKELGDIRDDFRLPAGYLKSKNPDISKKYKPGTLYNLNEGIRESNWDEAKAQKGDKFIVDPELFRPSKGFFGNLFD